MKNLKSSTYSALKRIFVLIFCIVLGIIYIYNDGLDRVLAASGDETQSKIETNSQSISQENQEYQQEEITQEEATENKIEDSDDEIDDSDTTLADRTSAVLMSESEEPEIEAMAGGTYVATDFGALKDKIESMIEGEELIVKFEMNMLFGNATDPAPISVPPGVKVTIITDGEDRKLEMDENAWHQRHFNVWGTLIINDGVILCGSETNANYQGGGIYLRENAGLELNGATISKCSARDGGGAVYMQANTTFEFNSGKIDSCGAYDWDDEASSTAMGGAISMKDNANLNMKSDAVISNCYATSWNTGSAYGGAIYMQDSAAANIDGGTISGCRANASEKSSSTSSDGDAYGGAVYLQGDAKLTTTGNTTLENCTAVNAKSSGDAMGGGIYSEVSSQIALSGSTKLSYCVAEGESRAGFDTSGVAYGGGIYIGGTGSHKISDSVLIDNCRAVNAGSDSNSNAMGGGIYINGSTTLEVTGSAKLSNCSVVADVASGTREQRGGGILADGSSVLIMSGGTISNARATDGAGICLIDSASMNFTGGTITDSEATNWVDESIRNRNNNTTGGGISVFDDAKLSMTETASISKCFANGFQEEGRVLGGGIYSESANEIIINGENVKIENCTANNNVWKDNNVLRAYPSSGGGIHISNGKLSFINGVISGSMSYGQGGGISAEGSGDSKPIVSIVGGSITECRSYLYGGGVHLENISTSSTVSGIEITDSNSYSGGGMCIETKELSLEGITVKNCKAVKQSSEGDPRPQADDIAEPYGGGITVREGKINLDDNTLVEDCNAVYGGGVAVVGEDSQLSLLHVVINNCTSSETGGGMFISNGADVIMGTGSEEESEIPQISGSESKDSGGGVYLRNTGSSLNMKSGLISDCHADKSGGGINIINSANAIIGTKSGDRKAKLEDCHSGITEGENIYGNGGGISVLNTGSKIVLNATAVLDKCISDNNGGGVYLDNAEITMNDGVIRNSNSGNGGGIFAFNSSSIDMKAGTISSCKAEYFGGGVTIKTNSTFNMYGIGDNKDDWPAIKSCITAEDYWGRSGGGISISDNSILNINRGVIDGCKANGISTGANNIEDLGFGGGGGIYMADFDSKCDIQNAYITNNSAKRFGGGIYTYNYNGIEIDSDTTYFSGNSASGINKAAEDLLIDNTSLYPCSLAKSISVTNDQIGTDKLIALNNYDINYLSYEVVYHGNGGTRENDKTTYTKIIEYNPYKSGFADIQDLKFTVINNKSDNVSEDTTNYSYEEFDFNNWTLDAPYIAGATRYSGGDTCSSAENAQSVIYAGGGYKLNLYARWTTDVKVSLATIGAYADKTKLFNVEVKLTDSEGNPVPFDRETSENSGLMTANWKNKDYIVIKNADVQAILDVKQTTVLTGTGYELSYRDDLNEGTEIAKVIDENYISNPVSEYYEITIQNQRGDVVFSGMESTTISIFVLILISLSGIFIMLYLRRYKRGYSQWRIK